MRLRALQKNYGKFDLQTQLTQLPISGSLLLRHSTPNGFSYTGLQLSPRKDYILCASMAKARPITFPLHTLGLHDQVEPENASEVAFQLRVSWLPFVTRPTKSQTNWKPTTTSTTTVPLVVELSVTTTQRALAADSLYFIHIPLQHRKTLSG